ncbi:MAG: hypothetical protein ACRDTD_18210 [Pseudonocardiaceae bacterium]
MTTITFRPDDESERALASLTADGRSASAAIRDALVHEAQRLDDERLRVEAVALVADPNDVAEGRRVIEDLEPLRAW